MELLEKWKIQYLKFFKNSDYVLNSTSETSDKRAFELEDDSEEITQNVEQRDKKMEKYDR